MSKTVDLVVLMGNLGNDASSATVNDGTVAAFRMATEHPWRQADGTHKGGVNWRAVNVWNSEDVYRFVV